MMKVDYTLPGLQPAVTRQPHLPPSGGVSFQSRLRRLSARATVGWKQLLRLDVAPANTGHIGSPPKPASLETRDAADRRLRWRNLLDSHQAGESQPAVTRMLALLGRMQETEDAMISRHVSESRG
jgi:hypothetical protein